MFYTSALIVTNSYIMAICSASSVSFFWSTCTPFQKSCTSCLMKVLISDMQFILAIGVCNALFLWLASSLFNCLMQRVYGSVSGLCIRRRISLSVTPFFCSSSSPPKAAVSTEYVDGLCDEIRLSSLSLLVFSVLRPSLYCSSGIAAKAVLPWEFNRDE